MKIITQENLSDISTTNLSIMEQGYSIKLGDLMKLLEERYPGEFGNDIAVVVRDHNGEEVYYCDCTDYEGNIDDYVDHSVETIELNHDWYFDIENNESSTIEKMGYEIGLYKNKDYDPTANKMIHDLISYEKIDVSDDYDGKEQCYYAVYDLDVKIIATTNNNKLQFNNNDIEISDPNVLLALCIFLERLIQGTL